MVVFDVKPKRNLRSINGWILRKWILFLQLSPSLFLFYFTFGNNNVTIIYFKGMQFSFLTLKNYCFSLKFQCFQNCYQQKNDKSWHPCLMHKNRWKISNVTGWKPEEILKTLQSIYWFIPFSAFSWSYLHPHYLRTAHFCSKPKENKYQNLCNDKIVSPWYNEFDVLGGFKVFFAYNGHRI